MNSLSRTQKPRAGFTLLEVMVVIVILGVLASLVVPNLLGNKEKADRQKAISDIVALENALDMYRLDNGRYPTTEQGLEALIQHNEADLSTWLPLEYELQLTYGEKETRDIPWMAALRERVNQDSVKKMRTEKLKEDLTGGRL